MKRQAINVRFSDADMEFIDEICRREEISRSEFLRQLVLLSRRDKASWFADTNARPDTHNDVP